MVLKIAVAGKGGTGKTTFTALLIRLLKETNHTPILAVDADPNSNLNDQLGILYNKTIADIREEVLEKKMSSSISKSEYIELHLNQAVNESEDIDLLVMGRPEGKGCYCYVNDLLRGFLEKINKGYNFVVIDNEAGLEHLSRRTTDNIDYLYIISTPATVGLMSAERIYKSVKALKLNINNIRLVVNQTTDINWELPAEFEDLKKIYIGLIPEDSIIRTNSEKGGDIFKIPVTSPVIDSINTVLQKDGLLIKKV